ncbi:MAG: 4Fe-4S binding protein [Candidatus Helarchaeota archaeon]
MEAKEGRFYSPRMKMVEVCHKCRACIYACPVKAIEWGVGEIIVDRFACAQHVFKKGECFNCVVECHQGAIVLEEYELKDGKITKIG